MGKIGTEVRETLKLVPAKAILRRDLYYAYACESCEKNDGSTPIVKAPKESSVIPVSFASPEAIAHIMTQKYEYQPSWRAEHAAKFLEGFSGYLYAGGYQGYHKLPENIRVVGCWARPEEV